MDFDLKNFIESYDTKEKIPLNLIKEIIKQILHGLAYIHLEGVLHRDLKPQNIGLHFDNMTSFETEENDFIKKFRAIDCGSLV